MNTSFPQNDENYFGSLDGCRSGRPSGSRLRTAPGFTLTEILIAIALIVIITTVAVTNITGVYERGQEQAAHMFVSEAAEPALLSYRIDMGSYPTTDQGLRALVEKPAGAVGWRGPYLKADAKLQDPWNSDYQYAYPGAHNPQGYDLWSDGPDKTSGTADDIGNW
jgi:general secretion pathway protein G